MEIIGARDDRDTASKSGSSESSDTVTILYGSQTGSARKLAFQFANELLEKYSKKAFVDAMDNYDLSSIVDSTQLTAIVFFVSSYGEGEQCDNASKTFSYLSKLCAENSHHLKNLHYGLFGLGNTAYDNYQGASRDLKHCLSKLGSTLLGSYGEGNDEKGELVEDYLQWKNQFMPTLAEHLRWKPSKEDAYKPSIVISEVSPRTHVNGEIVSSLRDLKFLDKPPYHIAKPFKARLLNSQKFTDGQRCQFHCEISLEGSRMKYQTGDHLGVYPINREEDVSKFMFLFCLSQKADQVVQLRSALPLWIPSPTTYKAIVKHYLNINSAISSQMLQTLANFAPPDISKDRLLSLSSRDLFTKEVVERRLTMWEVLLEASDGNPWPDVPFSFLLESLGKLEPRYYSIASSELLYPDQAHLTIKCERELVKGKLFYGVCSNYIESLCFEEVDQAGRPRDWQTVSVFVKKSSFKPPLNGDTPMIMVCVGTGIAPFRGFIQHRIALSAAHNVGKMILFYGCKDKSDILYPNEWPKYSTALESKLSVHFALSRENPARKQYVQDIILQLSKDIYELLEKGAYFYVCGDAIKLSNMSKLVRQILVQRKSISEEEAAKTLKQLKLRGRYQEDLW
ncbi:hypothetical protein OGATHE_002674 [Ogataea polymorpha]|uniref:NADPH--hemoprotein reductase n=1 Tax=Ogataea polymorpha TaxID=460523 RepID=A0A9P8PDI0_9ASCO|nr:hypothetical protein KL927_000862 [Ogataea polymorpha]KAH3669862.1 hypothetical protein OGATHE_002674 [Ogataea polymorpha]